MSVVAAGERHMNRVRAATADACIDEVTRYPEKAQRELAEAREALAPQRG